MKYFRQPLLLLLFIYWQPNWWGSYLYPNSFNFGLKFMDVWTCSLSWWNWIVFAEEGQFFLEFVIRLVRKWCIIFFHYCFFFLTAIGKHYTALPENYWQEPWGRLCVCLLIFSYDFQWSTSLIGFITIIQQFLRPLFLEQRIQLLCSFLAFWLNFRMFVIDLK